MGLAIKGSISNNAAYTTGYIVDRLMTMRFEISGQRGAISFTAAYAPAEVAKDETKQAFWGGLNDLVQRTPLKECVHVLMDANARTGKRSGESRKDNGVLGAY